MIAIDWNALIQGKALPPEGAEVSLEGAVFPSGEETPEGYLLLMPEAACCVGCRPEPDSTVEVLLASPARPGGTIRVAGAWHRLPPDDAAGWRWQLRDARILARGTRSPWLSRRGLLAAAPLVCAAPLVACAQDTQPSAAALALVAASAPMDLHSHAGGVIQGRRSMTPVAAPMREGGMALIALAMVADSPVIMVTPDRRLESFRSPAAGELWNHGQAAFARLQGLVSTQDLAVVTDQASLRRAIRRESGPSVVVAAEGADFLEGRMERLEQVFREQRLRHLQLTHYRVNELGDIQTAAPVHNGLTDFGVEVVRACNRLGIVVDIAHGPMALVAKAAEVTTKPLVLSHTALLRRPASRSRLITAEHARIVAGTGGVIGIWPLVGEAPTARLYAESMARMVEIVGVDHVGIGSDMRGLLGTGAFEDYRQTPVLTDALLGAGFDAAGVAKLMGGNYARVLGAVLPA